MSIYCTKTIKTFINYTCSKFSFYKNINSIELNCLYLRAKIKKRYLSDIDKEIIPIWLSAKSQPKSCDYVFRWFYKNKKLSDELVWQRIKMSLVKHVAQQLL